MGMPATREIGPFMQKIRALLLGRNHMNNLRFDHLQAPRSIPEPNMPPGPSHNLAANYYFTRDGRREVFPPAVLADGNKALSAVRRVQQRLPGLEGHLEEFATSRTLREETSNYFL